LTRCSRKRRELALTPDHRVRQPDLRHQVALGQQREDAGVDLVGLARQRRQALDLRRVSDQHIPAELLELVMHKPSSSHRLDHALHRLTVSQDAARQAAKPVSVRWRGELLNDLSVLRQQADVELLATQIQSSVQHTNGPPSDSLLG